MAVQKSKKSKSKTKIRRNNRIKFKLPSLSLNKETNEIHLRHFVSEQGYYKDKKVINIKIKKKK